MCLRDEWNKVHLNLKNVITAYNYEHTDSNVLNNLTLISRRYRIQKQKGKNRKFIDLNGEVKGDGDYYGDQCTKQSKWQAQCVRYCFRRYWTFASNAIPRAKVQKISCLNDFFVFRCPYFALI